MNNSFFLDFMFAIFPIVFVAAMAFNIAMLVSPKFRGKVMSRNIKAIKHMTEYSKEDIEDIGKTTANTAINIKKTILDDNGDTLKTMATNEANIEADAIKIKASAFKEGISGAIYCKHCGCPIDKDSRFCKHCGKSI